MKKILLISDSHGLIKQDVIEWIEKVDEIWHAGDIGDEKVLDQLESFSKPLRIVWGNIDNHKVRARCKEDLIFEIEELKVYITHIGGYPPRFNKRSILVIDKHKPDLYICGHSHICKIMPDQAKDLLHINPGACGIKGFHKYRTIVYFEVDKKKLSALKVIELGIRAKI